MVRVNFSRRPFQNERLAVLLYGAAALAVVAVTLVHGVVLTRYLLREREALDVKVQDLEQELAALDAAIREAEETLRVQGNGVQSERIRFLAGVYRQKSFSWTELFNELESITPPSVRFTSIAPKEDGGRIVVEMNVVGRSLEDVLEVVRRLEASALFEDVRPRDDVETDNEGGGVAATLRLLYVARPAETPERPSFASTEVVNGR